MPVLRPLAAGLAAAATLTAAGQTPLTTVRVCTGLSQPLFVTHAPRQHDWVLVVQRTGLVRSVNINTGEIAPAIFLDASSLVATAWLEYGLLSLAFHPDFANNRIFYASMTPPNGAVADGMIMRFQAGFDDLSQPLTTVPGSGQVILRFGYGGRREHRAGWIGFGPDGYLYASTGDGGENDPDSAAQNLTLLRGKILRLDVDGPDGMPGTPDDDGFPADPSKNYRIPPTNPYAGSPTNAQEIWASGLRNPWRCSFDRLTGDLWIGDVGQSTREEVDFEAAGAPGGRNYGWRCTEGTFCTGLSGCTCNAPSLTPPIFEYPRSVGVSVTGGYVYRGCLIPDLQGTYLYADYQLSKVFSLRYDGHVVSDARERTAELAPGGGLSLGFISSLGEDSDGELYFCDYSGGELFKLVPRSGPRRSISITRQPEGGYLCDIPSLTLSVEATTVSPPLTYRWFDGGTPLADSDVHQGTTTPSLTTLVSGHFRCEVSNACATIDSDVAEVTQPVCRAEYNCDGFIDFFDYLGFVQDFEAGAPKADVNRDGFLDFFDYDEFVEAFESSC